MTIQLYNTLSKSKEPFMPLKSGEVSMYNCGPTVYDRLHIGNFRASLFADTLRRMFEFNGMTVRQITNITDVGHLVGDGDDGDDKMTKALKRANKPLTLEAMREVATIYFDEYVDDLRSLNVELPEKFPRASDHIQENIDLIKILETKGYTYETSDGIYFDTSKFSDYGKLGRSEGSKLENFNSAPLNPIPYSLYPTSNQSRIVINPEKHNPTDFALWKKDGKVGWESPWGKGFPGWHIECSAMSTKYLGQPFDIHAGAIDLIPVHHNNEIAQSEAAYDKPLANYWMHNEFLIIGNSKMSKSVGNVITLQTLQDESISPIAYRYWLLTAHYRTPINFSFEAVRGAQNALIRLMATVSDLRGQTDVGTPSMAYIERFMTYINDDLDTPQAVALTWELIKDTDVLDADKLSTLLEFDRVLGLGLVNVPGAVANEDIPEEISALVDAREQARKEKDWTKSDALRAEIETRGYAIKDTDKGVRVTKE